MRDLQIQDTESNKNALFGSQFLATQEEVIAARATVDQCQAEL